MKIAIGVIDHHSLQVERSEEVAAHIRMALKHIPAGAARAVLRLRHGPGGDGAPACAVQDGLARAGHEHRAPGARGAGGECLAADPKLTLLTVTDSPKAAKKKTAKKAAAKKAPAKKKAKTASKKKSKKR